MSTPEAHALADAPANLLVEAPTVFYLIRHAHAPWPGPEGNTCDTGRALAAEGHAAAQTLAAFLGTLPIDHIVCSEALRARQTVAPLAQRLGLHVAIEPDLQERKLAAEPFTDLADFHEAVRATWQDPHFAHPGGETNASAQVRGVAAIRDLVADEPGAHVAIGTHGNLLTLILQHYVPDIGYGFWASLRMPDLVILTVGPGGVGTMHRPGWREV